MLCIFSLKREESFYSSLLPFILLGCWVCRVKYKELMPELLTANYPAPVSPLPSPRQADVELMQGRVSLPLQQPRHYKQPPFQSKYFTIFNTSPAGRVEKLLFGNARVVCFDRASCFRIIQITNTDPDERSETARREGPGPAGTTTTARGATASTTTTAGACPPNTQSSRSQNTLRRAAPATPRPCTRPRRALAQWRGPWRAPRCPGASPSPPRSPRPPPAPPTPSTPATRPTPRPAARSAWKVSLWPIVTSDPGHHPHYPQAWGRPPTRCPPPRCRPWRPGCRGHWPSTATTRVTTPACPRPTQWPRRGSPSQTRGPSCRPRPCQVSVVLLWHHDGHYRLVTSCATCLRVTSQWPGQGRWHKTLVTFQRSGNHFYVLMNTNWGLEALILFYFATCWNFRLRAFWQNEYSVPSVIIASFLFSSPPDKLCDWNMMCMMHGQCRSRIWCR